MTTPLIFIVEDEHKLALLLKDYLHQAQYAVEIFSDGNDVVEVVKQHPPDAILLDIMLPGKDGIQICSEIRRFSQVPILMLTARVEEVDRLIGLEIGADDYICKPFSPREVVARVKAVLRRTLQPDIQNKPLLGLDDNRMLALTSNQKIVLTAVEFKMLKCLLSEPGRIFSRDHLMDIAYDDHRIVSYRTIDSHIKKLRKKLNDEGGLDLIRSVYGVGYKIVESVEDCDK
ncbi:MAG: two-component system response regulator BaeR [Aliiglaciecola sp.]|uniref:response regulator n=1 Tax=Aliiglaciecola sp. M165 TaxID=2593649 RepID=UPI00118002B1|nr:response regulator [Aliiglaciecola sp. M165]TRY29745.1 response regulator [Aliiglaciecola sp. M165]